MEADRYLSGRGRKGGPAKIVLEEPRFSRPYALLSVALLEVLRYGGDTERTLTAVMGATGDAFRIGIAAGCDRRGLSTYDWSFGFYGAAERLGWSARCFGRPGRRQVQPEQQVGVLRLIHDAVEAGRPAILWNLTINEFDMSYGFDDSERMLFGRSHRPGVHRYTYESLGRSPESPGLFAAVLDRRTGAPASVRTILAGIVKQIRGDEPRVPGLASARPLIGNGAAPCWTSGSIRSATPIRWRFCRKPASMPSAIWINSPMTEAFPAKRGRCLLPPPDLTSGSFEFCTGCTPPSRSGWAA